MSDVAPQGGPQGGEDLPFERLVLLAGNFNAMRMVVTWELAWNQLAAQEWDFSEEADDGGLTAQFVTGWAKLSGVREPAIEEEWPILLSAGILEPGAMAPNGRPEPAWTSEVALNYVRAEMASKFPKAR